MREVSNNHNRF